jgi:soluble lytic murein transglycosylase
MSPIPPATSSRPALTAAALVLLLTASVAAGATDAQRSAFLNAEQALRDGDRERFVSLAERLGDYPLHPYLALADLLGRLDSAEPAEIDAFLARYPGTGPGEHLRLRWLKRLAREGRWQEYVDAYVDNGSETRECLYRRGLLALGRREAAFAGIDRLYLTGRSLPDACDPLFEAWLDSDGLRPELVRQRVALALARGSTGVARFQRRYLPPVERPWLDRLLAIHARPETLASTSLPPDPAWRELMLVHGIERLARRDPDGAADFWSGLRDHERLSVPAQNRVHAAIGAELARRGDLKALGHLRRITASDDDIGPQRTRLRAALRLRAWADLALWAEQFPQAADELGEWRYWLARARAQTGDLAGAAHAFERAANERSLWGFRAAELIGRPLPLDHRPAAVDGQRLEALLAGATAARIRELSRLGRGVDVNREWRELTRDMSPAELITAAALAARLGLVTESIFTLARAGYWDDLELRFPMPYRGLVANKAASHGLPADWVYAVMRQESAFDKDVASHAGAVGLMQLMPGTAAEMAAEAGEAAPSTLALIDPQLNIELGSRYLAAMRRRFDGHSLLATAAYNAGPSAVARWLPDRPVAADLWITEIPYGETRDYVRRVLAYRVIYASKLGSRAFRVGGLLRPVGPPREQPDGAD